MDVSKEGKSVGFLRGVFSVQDTSRLAVKRQRAAVEGNLNASPLSAGNGLSNRPVVNRPSVGIHRLCHFACISTDTLSNSYKC